MRYLVVIAGIVFLLSGCGGNKPTKSEDQERRGQKETQDRKSGHEHDSHGNMASKSLELNKGEKWVTDESTRQGMEKIDSLVQSYTDRQNLDLSDYNKLGSAIQSEMKTILNECLMKGQGHKELHKFISKMHPHIQTLKKEDRKKSEKSFEKIQELLAMYPKYFQ